jgi:hypothetical protein
MIPLDRLSQIIPPDQALANKALASSLQNISGIAGLSLPAFATIVGQVETNKDLPLIDELKNPVPQDVVDYYESTLGQGTGPNGTLRVVDVLGSAAGWNLTEQLVNTVEILDTLNLASLISIYQDMSDTVDGVYGDPWDGPIIIPLGPAAGTYLTADDAFVTGLIPAAQSAILSAVSANASAVTQLNEYWTTMAEQISREQTLQPEAEIDWANYPSNNRNSIYGLIFNLSTYGTQSQVGGSAQFIELLTDLSTRGGQAIVASLREGRNRPVLNNSGITTNSNIPSEPNPPPPAAELIPSKYNETEAVNILK